MEHRVSALERGLEKLDGKLDRLIDSIGEFRLDTGNRLVRIEEKLEHTASASSLAGLKGRVDALPTTWQMITLVIGIVGTILGGAFLILKYGLPHSP